MPTEDVSRLSMREYFTYLDRAAGATSAAEVERLRTQVLERWPAEPWTEDLMEALYAHRERLAAHENPLRVETGHILSGGDHDTEQLTA